MFSYNITWGATKKEVERSNFWLEIPKILKRFWLSFAICFVLMVMMIIFSTDLLPPAWQVPSWNWAVIFPLALVVGCHFLFPVRPSLCFVRRGEGEADDGTNTDCAQPVADGVLVLIVPPRLHSLFLRPSVRPRIVICYHDPLLASL